MRRPGHGAGCCYDHGGATRKNGRRRVRLKPLNPATADLLFDKIESVRMACIGKRDTFGAAEQTMAKLSVLVSFLGSDPRCLASTLLRSLRGLTFWGTGQRVGMARCARQPTSNCRRNIVNGPIDQATWKRIELFVRCAG